MSQEPAPPTGGGKSTVDQPLQADSSFLPLRKLVTPSDQVYPGLRMLPLQICGSRFLVGTLAAQRRELRINFRMLPRYICSSHVLIGDVSTQRSQLALGFPTVVHPGRGIRNDRACELLRARSVHEARLAEPADGFERRLHWHRSRERCACGRARL
jgi:hypothetical protein